MMSMCVGDEIGGRDVRVEGGGVEDGCGGGIVK